MRSRTRNKIKYISVSNGFTLIEMLVTLIIIAVGLVGVVSFFNTSLASNYEAKNELIAAHLAQESNEIIRNIVSRNVMLGSQWFSGITSSNAVPAQNQCDHPDISDLTNHACSNTTNYNVCLENNRYVRCTGTHNTDFTRQTVISGINQKAPASIDLTDGDCVLIKSTVIWNGRTTETNDVLCKPSY